MWLNYSKYGIGLSITYQDMPNEHILVETGKRGDCSVV
ncbi:MAG: hypothetical protein ACJAZP_003895 [Psychromonas sp.]|jgi:hypothetical protein